MPVRSEDDHYAVLGVRAYADGEALRLAWRQLASRWHPDRAGDVATAMFQRLSAAYAVLSDPLARAAYDRRRRGGSAAVATPDAPTAAGSPPRPARPPAPGVMLSRLARPIWLLLTSGAARYDDGDEPGLVTLVFRPEEAAQGGMITIAMRVDVWCPACSTAQPRPAACARCGGTRKVEELFSAWLAVPPGVVAGEVLAPSVELPGTVDPVRFRVELFGQAR